VSCVQTGERFAATVAKFAGIGARSGEMYVNFDGIAGTARPTGSFVKTAARLEVTVVIPAVIAETAARIGATSGETGAGFAEAEFQL
jgi:hypothetical protein